MWFLPEVEYYYGWYLGNGSTVILENIGVELTDVNIEDSPEDYIGESFGIKQVKYIEPQNALMPPIYRNSLGEERFYNAINGDGGYKNPVDGF